MKKQILYVVWGILAMVIAIPLFAQNVVPNPPKQLSAVPEELSDGSFNVKLLWSVNQSGNFPEGFKIYKTVFQNGMVKTFFEAEVQAKQGQYQYYYVVKNLQAGTYEFYATSYIGKAESKPSNTVRVDLFKQQYFIQIISQPPTFAYVGKKYFYQVKAYSNINCPIDIFEFEGSYPEGMTISSTGLVEWTPSAIGTYEVTIKVGTTCKINVKPAYQKYKIIVLENPNNDKPYVKIVSQPPATWQVGVPLKYQVIAESNIRCPIKFKIAEGNMEGAQIDENTGLLTWTPKTTGLFGIVIIAYLSCDTNVLAYQRLCIKITESGQNTKHCAHIIGSAKFQDNTSVPNGLVYAWKLDANDNQTNVVFKTFIKDGSFEFYLPQGTYVFEFYGELFEHSFFANATRFIDATKVKLECLDNQVKDYTIEMILQKKPQPTIYSVSGYVKSAKDDTPVLAVVEFIPVEFLFNPDKKENYGFIQNFVTKTDQNGFYQIKLPNTFTYIAHAVPSYSKALYKDQYYHLSNSPYLADIIELTEDRDDINFLLEPIEKQNNGFSGIVIDKDRNPIQSRVMAILVAPKQQFQNVPKYNSIAVVETNDNGQFTFTNLIPGDYVLLSVPKDKQYAPGYYKQNDFATLKWKDASIISVDQSMIQIIFEIKHRNRSGWKGLVRCEGKVVEATGNIKIFNEPQSKEPPAVQEALVCALDQNGDVIDYYITDAYGKFILETLPPTTIKLMISKVGYKDLETSFKGDYESNFAINSTIYIEKEVSEVYENNQFKVYQTEQYLFINFYTDINFQGITLYDVYGNSFSTKYNLSDNTLVVDISQLPSGIYLAKVKGINNDKVIKFVVVR
ncbi:MAG: hypothetical protein N2560_00095 [Ignavibacteria bacterium]|nr:hypothetical protein [Ignavibacteria bacterium]